MTSTSSSNTCEITAAMRHGVRHSGFGNALAEFQRKVLAVLADNRSESSHYACGLVLHIGDDSSRFSNDFDIFHEAKEEVARASVADEAALLRSGYGVEHISDTWNEPSSFRKARISKGESSVAVDWAADSAVRFFPVEPDTLLGWRLHLFDIATNKALALAARTETRDYVDIVELDREFPLEATCWAACGKDPGFSPLFLLKMMRRFAKIDPAELDKIKAHDLDPIALTQRWIEISDRAEAAIERVANSQPDLPIGIAFLDAENNPCWAESNPGLVQHRPSLRGCWPTVGGAE